MTVTDDHSNESTVLFFHKALFITLYKWALAFKAGVHVNRSEILSNIKGELLGLKWVGNTTRLVADCLISAH